MVPADFHDFFVGAASVAGALIGLLFVALSVARDHPADGPAGELHRLRAVGAFSAFINALVLSLWGLLPDVRMGIVAVCMAIVGLVSVAGSVVALVRIARAGHRRRRLDGTFVLTLLLLFAAQMATGVALLLHAGERSALDRVGDLVIVCFLVGTARAWELVGGPQVAIRSELAELRRESRAGADETA